jgi:hypothetical protein
MTLQTTSEPLTKAIDEHLPWVRLDNENMHIEGINSFQYKDGSFLNALSFIRGNKGSLW